MSDSAQGIRSPSGIVYLCGVATSLAVMYAVRFLDGVDFNLMGFYAWGIVPIGALAVGFVSGTGYAIGSRYLNLKLSRQFVAGMITTGFVDYIALQHFAYTSFLEDARISSEQLGFLRYLQETAENISFSRAGSSGAGVALGGFGYVFKLLEVAGFSVGAAGPAAILRGMPYCARCRQYLQAHATFAVESNALAKETLKLKSAPRVLALQAAIDEVVGRAMTVVEGVRQLGLADTLQELAVLGPPAKKSAAAARVSVVVKKCPRCDGHHLTMNLATFSKDKKPAQSVLATMDKPSLATDEALAGQAAVAGADMETSSEQRAAPPTSP